MCAHLQNLAALHLAHVEEELLAFILLVGEETKLALHSLHVGSQLLLVRLHIQRKILCLAHLCQNKVKICLVLILIKIFSNLNLPENLLDLPPAAILSC